MADLRLARPLWLDRPSGRATRSFPSLRRHLDVDVAVVGAGVTGAAVAWKLASSGLRVAVLEANLVGRGSTVASTALLMQEPDEDFLAMQERYGFAAAKRIWHLSGRATREFVRTIERLGIRCHLARSDSIYYTLRSDEVRSLRREHEARRRAGVGGSWLDAAGVGRIAGIEGAAAIRTHGNAQANPYELCLGLARAARKSGAEIFERSPVGRIVPDRTGVSIITPRATMRAAQVVMATGYATPEFKPLLGRFRMLHTYVVATPPLSRNARAESGLAGNVMLWDTGRPYFYARWTDDHRLLLGGADRPQVSGPRRRRALREGISVVRSYFEGVYPFLRGVPTEYAWEGLFATTPDSLPYIGPHRRYPRHLFALGYGGNGMTFGFLAADLLAERLAGRVSSDHDLFAFGRTR